MAGLRDEQHRLKAVMASARTHPWRAAALAWAMVATVPVLIALASLPVLALPVATLYTHEAPAQALWLAALWCGATLAVFALCAPVHRPGGLLMTRNGAPSLAARVEAVTRAVRGRRPHHIVVDVDTAIWMHHRPALAGRVGPDRRTLVVGVLAVLSLSDEELVAALAVAVVDPSEGRAARALVRTWVRLETACDALADLSATASILVAPLRHGLDRLELQATALGSVACLKADRVAAAVTRPTTVAASDARLAAVARAGTISVLRPLLARAGDPPEDMLPALVDGAVEFGHDPCSTTVTTLMDDRPTTVDRLPSFAERLEALGVTPAQVSFALATRPAPHEELVAEARTLLPHLARLLDPGPDWDAAGRAVRERVDRLAFLDRLEADGHLNGCLIRERDLLVVEFGAAAASVRADALTDERARRA